MNFAHSRIGSIALFLFVSIALEVIWMAIAGVFPGKTMLQAILGFLIGTAVVIANIWLNRAFLEMDSLPKSALGLGVDQLPWFLAGCAIAVPIVLGMAILLRMLVPFHWEPGASDWHDLAGQFSRYFIGNSVEELIFRGYLLVMLRRWLGLPRALAITGLLFGLFHLPGMSGTAALKMVCTTMAMSVVFAMAYLRTKSLWTAIGVHVFANLLLHRVLGLSGGASLFRPSFTGRWPGGYDPGLFALLTAAATGALCLFLWRGAETAKRTDQTSG